MPTLVRNVETGPTVFSDIPKGINIEWAGSGDPGGGDVQHVPDDVVTTNVQFLKAIQNGILQVVEASEDVKEKLALQVQAYRASRDRSKAVTADALDYEDQKPIMTAQVDEKGQIAFVPEVTERVVNGVAEETQIPVVMGPRERG